MEIVKLFCCDYICTVIQLIKGTIQCISSIQTLWLLFIFPFCAATIRVWRSFLWKAQMHQQWLDKVHMSETVTVARCYQ